MHLKNRVFLVTGASMGIGLCIARALLREGAEVAMAARSLDKLRALHEELGEERSHALPVAMDVTDDTSVAGGVARTLERFGQIDVLVNNAGRAGGVAPFLARDPEFLQSLFDVNVFGTERVMRAVLPSMLERHTGTIVNFASTLGYVPMPGAAAYSAAKAAVISLSTALREELKGSGVDVRVFSPPHTSTESGLAMGISLPKIFEPEWVATEFLRTMRGNRKNALPGGNSALLFLQRVSPGLAAHIMNGIGTRALARNAAAQRELPPKA